VRGASAPRRWGWHRLDKSWASRIVAAAGVTPGDLVLDIGAGDGALCAALLRVGACVLAVELHPDRVRRLRDRFSGRDVKVILADAADLRLPRRDFHVVANPPFAVAMAVVRRLVAPGSRLVAADVVVPRHIARRWCAGEVDGSGRWRAEYDMSTGLRVPAGSFRPAVGRDAVVLRIRRVGLGVERNGDRPQGRKAHPSQ
jgi:23S rRNA (adenine-N6)-dimethyltransferase